MNVLIATDGSKHAAAALQASRILRKDVELSLACVAPEVPGGENRHAQRFRRRALARASRIAQAAKDWLATDSGRVAKTRVEAGSAARILVRISRTYDLTIIGAKDRMEGSSAGLGPVAGRVVEHAASSVFIARDLRSEAGLRILVPVDGSDVALLTLDRLASFIDLSGAEVTLMHVVETPWLHAGLDQEWLGYEEEAEEKIDPEVEFEKELEREARAVIEEARLRLPVRTTVSPVLVEGLPADEILSEADRGDYDLVAVGASGVSDLKHQMLGSVSAKLAWNAPCSVLLVRSGE